MPIPPFSWTCHTHCLHTLPWTHHKPCPYRIHYNTPCHLFPITRITTHLVLDPSQTKPCPYPSITRLFLHPQPPTSSHNTPQAVANKCLHPHPSCINPPPPPPKTETHQIQNKPHPHRKPSNIKQASSTSQTSEMQTIKYQTNLVPSQIIKCLVPIANHQMPRPHRKPNIKQPSSLQHRKPSNIKQASSPLQTIKYQTTLVHIIAIANH